MLLGLSLGLPGDSTGLSQSEFAMKVDSSWLIFFLICGLLTTSVGIISFFLLPKDNIAPNREKNYLYNLLDGFRPQTIKANPLFYVCLLLFLFFNIAVDSFLPYYLVYFQEGLGFAGISFYGAMAIIIGVSSLLVILAGLFMDKLGKMKFLFPAIIAMALGALGLFFSGTNKYFAVFAAVVLMAGYLIGTAAIGARLRDETPEDKVGSLQGVRMIFAVMLPMVIGSNISLACFQDIYVNEYGQEAARPDKWMFIVTMVSSLIALAPAILLLVLDKRKARDVVQG